ncbi:hypothetical protein [Ruixingdingia sedimenti]|uniref:Acetophenone carboxylase-like C-terminal domain-containing protein n=1 Tax=Ruixingdingia sedimenti TaxID=3073604 RepID=A0ABU1FBG5_9RHOB|nr:hypothetical protein [Xinfangfangia sp. LG-4]MDR5654209.1 hypothetical protein [Xinfangfangia sp. LG-4]
MLHADIRHDVSLPLEGLAGGPGAAAMLARAEGRLRARGQALLADESVVPGGHDCRLAVDMRYRGQAHALPVPLGDPAALARDFHDRYRRQFGHAMPEAPVELVQMRLAAVGRIGGRVCDPDPPAAACAARADRRRPVSVAGRAHRARIVHRDGIGRGDAVTGPAIIPEAGATTFVPLGWTARRERFGALVIRRTPA